MIADHASRWSRLDADLHLASGRMVQAAQAYEDLASGATDRVSRGELLLGAAESAIITGAVTWGMILAGPANTGRVHPSTVNWAGSRLGVRAICK